MFVRLFIRFHIKTNAFLACVNVLVIKLQMENTKEKILFIIIRMYVRLHINNKCDYFFK